MLPASRVSNEWKEIFEPVHLFSVDKNKLHLRLLIIKHHEHEDAQFQRERNDAGSRKYDKLSSFTSCTGIERIIDLSFWGLYLQRTKINKWKRIIVRFNCHFYNFQLTEEKLNLTSDKTEFDRDFEFLIERGEATKLLTEKIVKDCEALLVPNPGSSVLC